MILNWYCNEHNLVLKRQHNDDQSALGTMSVNIQNKNINVLPKTQNYDLCST